MRLLVTRPEPDATRTAAALRALGHDVMVAPLMRVETIAAEFAGPFDAVLMTSANAARAAADHPRVRELASLPCFTVGDRSAEAARAIFRDVVSADGALGDLVALVAARLPAGARLLYLAGEDRAGDLGAALGAHGFTVETVTLYRAVALDALPGKVVPAELDGVLHYSRRSAATLLRLSERAGHLNAVLGLAHYCVSARAAEPLRERGAIDVRVAEKATEHALIALLG